MKINIYKNWLEKDLHEYLKNLFLHKTPHFFNQKSYSQKDETCFYITEFNSDNLIIDYLQSKIRKIINKPLIFHRIYINVQHPKMHGSFHVDEGNLTFIYMVKGEGDLEIKNENIIKFEENKLISFFAKKEHKAYAPEKGVRISLAFKTTILEENDRKNV